MEFSQRKASRNVTLITDAVIDRITKTEIFEDNVLDNKLYNLHRKLLWYAKENNGSREVGILWNYITDDYTIAVGTDSSINMNESPKMIEMMLKSYNNSLIFMHNHPKNSTFSYRDLMSFCDYAPILAMTAVCNDGRIHVMKKESNFDARNIKIEYNKYVRSGNRGVPEVIRNASRLGIIYRCSVPRRKERVI